MNWLQEILCEGSTNTFVESRQNAAIDTGGIFLNVCIVCLVMSNV